MPNASVSSDCGRRVEPCHRRPNAGCECWPPLTSLLTFDSASASCRIMHMTMCKFVVAASTNTCWQAALVHVECCTIAPQIHSKLQTFTTSPTSSCSSATAIDEAASTSSQAANSQGRCWHHERARPLTSPIAKKGDKSSCYWRT